MNLSDQTLSVHSGREDFSALGVHAPPLDFSSTYPIPHLEEGIASLDAFAEGAPFAANPIYARLFNPTVANFEKALADLEKASHGIAFSSGMAAITAALMATRIIYSKKPKTHVVAMRPLYGGTDHLLSTELLGLDITWAEESNLENNLQENTALIIVETPANPTLRLTNIRKVTEIAEDIPVMVDSTFATPILQKPLEHGATIVMHSATKFLGGHGDVLAGILATNNEQWASAIRQIRILTGGNLHPMAAWLCLRSMPTLPMRVEKAAKTAEKIFRRLSAHPRVIKVYYPTNKNPLVGTQMANGGSLISFEINGTKAMASNLMKNVRLCTPAVSLGSTDTLIQHPAGLTHRLVEEEAKNKAGISDNLIRLSIGLESAEDIWNDLNQALKKI